jgi:molybdenum cofactor biosynthesis protein B
MGVESANPLRCIVATVALGRASVKEDVTQVVIDGLFEAGFRVERSFTVNREKEFIRQLVQNIATSNEAEALLLLGGVGIGPRDYTCEAAYELADRRVEGFGEAYRQLLRDGGEAASVAMTVRAAAVVCNRCVVVALPRQSAAVVRRAMQKLVVPMLPEAVRIAVGLPRAQPVP